jgi:ATP-dependent DNA helicase UvrD/PcrA
MSEPLPAAPESVEGPPLPPVAGEAYLAALNEAQRRAVEAIEGPVLILASAGTGKTRVLTTRLAHLIASGRAFPGEILAVTFTNKAAREMRERLEAMIGGAANGVWLGTFHAIAARILRAHAERVGLKANFTILDADDQLRLLKQLLEALNIDERRWPARVLHSLIERWKDRGLAPDQVPRAERGAGSGASPGTAFAGGRAIELYRQYQERLLTINAVDFGDLLLHNLALFTGSDDVVLSYRQRFRYLLVDEYQDTNLAQYLWLRLLARERRNLCCVGDDDQSIYSWRGAEIGNILRFEGDFPGAQILRLEENYRSTSHILGAASGIIANNRGRLGKGLFTRAGAGQKVVVRTLWDGESEARWVGDEIENLQRRGHSLKEIAILVRVGFQTREFEDRFIALALPYRVVGGPRFYERQEIRDALAYLRLVNEPADDLAFERILNQPRRGIGSATLKELHLLARQEGLTLFEAARALLGRAQLRSSARHALGAFVAAVDGWRAKAATMPHPGLAQIVLDESGYMQMWLAEKTPDAPGRLENLKELIVAMTDFDNLGGFLEHVALVMDNAAEAGGEAVSLMTLHGAKGLEFDTVFLPGWEEGLFPNQRAIAEGGLAALEEERRLAYVGLTRARRRAVLSCAASRRIHGQWQSMARSRFLDELPPRHIEVFAEPGLDLDPRTSRGRTDAGEPEESSRRAIASDSRRTGERRARTDPGLRRGWGTAPAAAAARPPLLAAAAPWGGAGGGGSAGFAVGDRVHHPKFGLGSVLATDGKVLAIRFDTAGDKKVIDAFVERA